MLNTCEFEENILKYFLKIEKRANFEKIRKLRKFKENIFFNFNFKQDFEFRFV